MYIDVGPDVRLFAVIEAVAAVRDCVAVRVERLHEIPCAKQGPGVLDEPSAWLQLGDDVKARFDDGVGGVEIAHANSLGEGVLGARRGYPYQVEVPDAKSGEHVPLSYINDYRGREVAVNVHGDYLGVWGDCLESAAQRFSAGTEIEDANTSADAEKPIDSPLRKLFTALQFFNGEISVVSVRGGHAVRELSVIIIVFSDNKWMYAIVELKIADPE